MVCPLSGGAGSAGNLTLIRQNSEFESHFEIEKGLSLWLKEGATQTFNPQTKGHCR
jgi:hypothetical protein